jgi:putative transposase
MTKRKKHSREEISAKLAQATELAKQGKLQREVASTLGVSVMTLHRWRRPLASSNAPSLSPEETTTFARELGRTQLDGQGEQVDEQGQRIAELQLENSRLRRLVTDLLLEKMKLAEDMEGHTFPSDQMNLGRG